MESDSSNAVAWASNRKLHPWEFQFLFNEIRGLCSTSLVEFCHVNRLANSMADALAKQGVERSTPWVGVVM